MSRQAYDRLAAELAAIERATGLYLADENVDRENVADEFPEQEFSDDAGPFWKAMIDAASSAAGMRAENEGKNINVLIGRVIY